MSNSLMSTYLPQPVTFVRGESATLWDDQGRTYLDALSGIAVTNLGHAHPAVTQAICAQAGQLIHTSNLYRIGNQQQLGDMLTAFAGMDRVFFSNSGAEANEAAIKLARLYGHRRGIERPAIVVMESSFHGRTLATLSATGNRKVHAGFEPLVSGFVRVPYNDMATLRSVAASNQSIVAILVEPVQGEGGVHIPAANYLEQVRQLCDEQQWLMMLDEIQTGMGRSGKPFAYMHSTIAPDVMTLAKGLGNGVPIGACLARGDAANLFQPGNHGSTFGGNPLVCAAAMAVVTTLQQENLAARATTLGRRIAEGLRLALKDNSHVLEVRHLGLLIGVELDAPCADLVATALAHGLLINVTAERVIRLLPPLILSDSEADHLVKELALLINAR
ncbi:MAG: aspartate aminotransferase family protein [Gammaproteobacteria bacterium]|nr:aspartate aminotransferase family protein [Gammaproteobacteria bacterium]